MARSKRPLEDAEEYVEDDGDREMMASLETPFSIPLEVQNMAYKMVRGVLAMEYKRITITKNQLQRIVWESQSYKNVKFDLVFKVCQEILETIYGLKMQELPGKEVDSSKKYHKAAKKSGGGSISGTKGWIVISILTPSEKDLLNTFWMNAAKKYFKQVDKIGSIHENKMLPSDPSTLTNNALIMIIISCVALMSNNVNREELLKYLKKNFDLTLNNKIPGIIQNNEPITLEEYFRLLERFEYLHKKVEKNNEVELIEYSLGRRAKVEFPKESLYEFVKLIYGYNDDEKNQLLLKQVELSVGQTYDI